MKKQHSKADELTILDAAIDNLGPDSYLGPWLSSVRGEVLRDITSDLPPAPTITDARNAHGAIVADAKNIAGGIIREAERKAKELIHQARCTCDSARSMLGKALRELE